MSHWAAPTMPGYAPLSNPMIYSLLTGRCCRPVVPIWSSEGNSAIDANLEVQSRCELASHARFPLVLTSLIGSSSVVGGPMQRRWSPYDFNGG